MGSGTGPKAVTDLVKSECEVVINECSTGPLAQHEDLPITSSDGTYRTSCGETDYDRDDCGEVADALLHRPSGIDRAVTATITLSYPYYSSTHSYLLRPSLCPPQLLHLSLLSHYAMTEYSGLTTPTRSAKIKSYLGSVFSINRPKPESPAPEVP